MELLRGGALTAPADSPQPAPTDMMARPAAHENDIARLEEEVKQFSEAS